MHWPSGTSSFKGKILTPLFGQTQRSSVPASVQNGTMRGTFALLSECLRDAPSWSAVLVFGALWAGFALTLTPA